MKYNRKLKIFKTAKFVKCLLVLQCEYFCQVTANATVIIDGSSHQYPEYYEHDWVIRNNVDAPLDSVDDYNYITYKLSDQIKVGVKYKNLSKTGIVIEAKLKKCDDKKYPIYNIKRSSVCGVYGYRNIRNASCGVESYQRCTPDPVKYRDKYSSYIYYETIENGGTYPSHWEDGMESDDHCRKIGNSKPWMKLDMFKSKDPNSYFEMASFTRYTEDLRDLIFNNRVKARHYCEFTLNYKSAQYFPVRDQVCGVEKYNVCSQETVYNQCRDVSHGIERYRQLQSLLCPFTLNKVIVEQDQIFDYTKNRSAVNMELECTQNNPALKLGCLILSNNMWFGRSNPHPVLYRQIADLLTSEVVINNQLLELLDQLDLSQIDMGQLKIQMDKSVNQKYSNVDSYVKFITSFGRKLMNSNLSSEQVTKSVKLIEVLLNAEKVSQFYQNESFMIDYRQNFIKNSFLQNSIKNSQSINVVLFYYSQLVGNVISNNNYSIYLLYYAKNQLKQYQNLNSQLKQQISQIIKDPDLSNKLYAIQSDNIQDAFNLLNTTITSISQKNDRLISMTESDVIDLTKNQRPFELIPLYFSLGRYQDIIYSIQDSRSVLNSDYFKQIKDWLNRVAQAKMTQADKNVLVLSQLAQPSMSLINQLEIKTRNNLLMQLSTQQNVLNTVVQSLTYQMNSDLESLNRVKEMFNEKINMSDDIPPPRFYENGELVPIN